MKAELVALSIIFASTVANLLVSTVAVALGAFVAASPDRAAKIWGSQRLDNLAPERRPSFMRWYRVFGILLCVAGVLLAVDSIVLPNHHH
jgi:membrane protein YqaA with SNARE-associated domain